MWSALIVAVLIYFLASAIWRMIASGWRAAAWGARAAPYVAATPPTVTRRLLLWLILIVIALAALIWEYDWEPMAYLPCPNAYHHEALRMWQHEVLSTGVTLEDALRRFRADLFDPGSVRRDRPGWEWTHVVLGGRPSILCIYSAPMIGEYRGYSCHLSLPLVAVFPRDGDGAPPFILDISRWYVEGPNNPNAQHVRQLDPAFYNDAMKLIAHYTYPSVCGDLHYATLYRWYALYRGGSPEVLLADSWDLPAVDYRQWW